MAFSSYRISHKTDGTYDGIEDVADWLHTTASSPATLHVKYDAETVFSLNSTGNRNNLFVHRESETICCSVLCTVWNYTSWTCYWKCRTLVQYDKIPHTAQIRRNWISISLGIFLSTTTSNQSVNDYGTLFDQNQITYKNCHNKIRAEKCVK